MGVTYKAWDEKLRVPVALKVITPTLVENPRVQALFLREARSAARVHHTHVASVLSLSDTPGNFYYAMEFVDGVALDAFLRERGPLAPLLALDLAAQIAHGLGAIHAQGLIHRDLKPANVVLLGASSAAGQGGAWTAKIIDFGLARFLAPDAADEDPALVTIGFRGTALYASPEQCEEQRDLDGRADLYSLGCILWEMLVGTPVFSARTHRDLLNAHVNAPPPWERVAHLPAGVREVLVSLLRKDRDERPADAAAAARALEGARRKIEPQADGDGAQTAPFPPDRADGREAPAALAAVDPRSSSRRRRWLAGVAILAFAAAGLAGRFQWRATPPSTPTAPPAAAARERSIAVLPFENASEDKADSFFADGLQDDLLASLAKIKDLAIVSRSSVQPFRGIGGAEKLREAGRLLGVAHLLEGRVRRAGLRVVLNVVLTDVLTGRQVWAERYDRTLADALTLQGELAQEIARELRATLSPEEKARVSTKPTESTDAYVLYLRARDLETRHSFSFKTNQTITELYAAAIAHDSNFALARARLATVLTVMYINGLRTTEIQSRARAEFEEALRLQPQLGEAHLARAGYVYRIEQDYEGALRELEIAARLLPNDAEVESVVGYIQRRQGRWREALATAARSIARDPRNVILAEDEAILFYDIRDWPGAARAGDRVLGLAPNSPSFRFMRGAIDFWMKNDPAPLRAAAALPAEADPDGLVTFMRWDAALLVRDFPAAERALVDKITPPVISFTSQSLPLSYLRGGIALARGEPALAREQKPGRSRSWWRWPTAPTARGSAAGCRRSKTARLQRSAPARCRHWRCGRLASRRGSAR